MSFISMAARRRRYGNASYPPGGGTAPTITDTPLLTDEEISISGTLPITFYGKRSATSTPLSAAAIEAAPDDTEVLAGGANYLSDLTLETAPGTYWYNYFAKNAFGSSAVETESYTIVAPAIQYVGGKTWTTTGTGSTTSVSLTDLTGGLAAAPAAGDFVVVAYTIGGNGDPDRDVAVTSGYTEVADLYANSFIETNFGVFYKFMPGTPDTTVTMGTTFGAGVYGGAAAIHVWRGVNVTTPMDVTAVTVTGTGTSNPNGDPITPTTADAVILVAGGGGLNQSGGSYSHASSDLSNFQTAWVDSIIDVSVGLGSFEWTSGAFDPAAWTGGETTGNNSWAAVTLALRPA